MTKVQAEVIKSRVAELNKLYAPMVLRFDMINTSQDIWAVTIVFNYTPDEWFTFISLGMNFSEVYDKLSGWQYTLEAVQAYQEEHGTLIFENSKTV